MNLAPRTFSLFLVLLISATAAESYKPINRISVPGDYGWDYLGVDEAARRLYVTHDSEVVVIDLATGSIAGKIPKLRGVHGVAIVAALDKGFITNGTPGTVTMFDTKTLRTLGEVKVGENPNCVLFEPATERIFTADRGSKQMTAIDPKTGKVVGTIGPLDGKTEYAVADGKGHIFLNIQDKANLLRLDARNLKVMDTWPLAPCAEATSITMDRKNARVFVGCRSGVMVVVNAVTGKVVQTVPIGMGVDATTFDAERGIVFNSNGDGTLTVIRQKGPDEYGVVENVKTMPGARTMALDSRTHRIYLPAAEYEPGPTAAEGQPRRRGKVVPASFGVLVVGQ